MLTALYYNPNYGHTGAKILVRKINLYKPTKKTGLVNRKFMRCIHRVNIDSEQDELLFLIIVIRIAWEIPIKKKTGEEITKAFSFRYLNIDHQRNYTHIGVGIY